VLPTVQPYVDTEVYTVFPNSSDCWVSNCFNLWVSKWCVVFAEPKNRTGTARLEPLELPLVCKTGSIDLCTPHLFYPFQKEFDAAAWTPDWRPARKILGVLIRHRKMEGMLKSRTWIQVLSSCAEIPTALKSQSTLHVHALVIHILNCHFSFQNTVHTLSIILYCTLFHLQARSFNHAAFDIAEGSGSNSQSAELSKPKLFLFLMAPPKKYYNLFHSISSE
jgi:hypothetical protein